MMAGPWRLAWMYVRHHALKSLILIASIVLTALLPIAIKLLLWQFNAKILVRADQTPAVIGPLGSDLDLALNACYFRHQPKLQPIPYGEVTRVAATGLAVPIPIHARYTARGYHVVGTSLDYFSLRQLQVAQGTPFTTLGDCVLGSRVARQLGLSVGDQLISDRENAIGFGGQTPLKMNVCGVLADSRSPDDWAVFVDLKTAWVIEGLGHGHEDLNNEPEDSVKILSRDDKQIIASAGVASFIEIRPDNLDSFHFHGDTSGFPVTSIIVVAPSVKEETLLQGRYATDEPQLQFTKPAVVIRELMEMVFRINRFFDANAILIALSTMLLLILVVSLSLRLRQREMETMFRIGCSRGTIAWLQIDEMLIIFAAAGLLVASATWLIWLVSGDLVESLLVG